MSWDKEGQQVRGMYLHQYPVEGLVVMSRVKYGAGDVQHLVKLNKPMVIYGTERELITLDEKELIIH